MSDGFVALPVGQGDAFFLKENDFCVLVDGGKSANRFPIMFQNILNRKSVDVLVCTHNDADHANGILGFLQAGLKCKELWLPGSWGPRLQDLIDAPSEFLAEVEAEIINGDWPRNLEDGDRSSLDLLGDRFSEQLGRDELDSASPTPPFETRMSTWLSRNTQDDMRSDINDMTNELNHLPSLLDWHRAESIRPSFWMPLEFSERNLWLEVVAAANRIKAIANAALDQGIPIRWFEFSKGSVGGGLPDRLVPVNSMEIVTFRPPPPTALEYLALTTANRESLVFASPTTEKSPGVLFSADSDFQFPAQIPWSHGMIVTAPHHGSESNSPVYARAAREAPNLNRIWVRSDGNFKSRPGESYLNQSTRYCTLCRGAKNEKQAVRFRRRSQNWCPIVSRRCRCNAK